MLNLIKILLYTAQFSTFVATPPEPLIDYKGINQARINRVFDLYKHNGTLASSSLDANNYKEINSGFYVVNGFNEYLEFSEKVGGDLNEDEGEGISDHEELYIMLASTSKLPSTIYGVSKASDKVQVTYGVFSELLYRESKRITQKPEIYNPVLRTQLGLTAAEVKSLANLDWGYTAALNKLATRMKGKKVYLPLAEVLYHDLTLSSNSAAEVIKNIAVSPKYPQLGQFEMNYKLGTPSHEITISIANIMHWRQSAANTGKLSELTDLMSKLVNRGNLGLSEEAEQLIINSMTNNKSDFGFDFTNSLTGKKLKSQGWKIVEKTGYYPVVFWIEDLTNGVRGSYPTHMTLSTIVSLIPPKESDHEIITFSYYKNIEVVPPIKRVRDRSTGLSVPNDWDYYASPGYLDYLSLVKGKQNMRFRSEMTKYVGELIKL